MRLKLLKFGTVTVFTLALFFCFSFSAFAADIDFTLSDYPSSYVVNDTSYQSYDYIFMDVSGNYRYAVVQYTFSSSYPNPWNDFTLMPFVCNNVATFANSNIDSTTCFLFPVIEHDLFNTWVYPTYRFLIYDTSGNLLTTTNQSSTSGRIWQSYQYYIPNLLLSSYALNNAQIMALHDSCSFVVLHNNTIAFQGYPNPHNPTDYNVVSDISYYDYIQEEQLDCSIPDVIKINGVVVYDPDSGSGSGSVISGTASGSVPDGQGGSQDVNFDINLDLPEYDGDIGTDEFPTMPEFDDSALSVIDGGSALQWVYARVNDLVTTNQKIFALVTSCLSLGVIMLILNKRS